MEVIKTANIQGTVQTLVRDIDGKQNWYSPESRVVTKSGELALSRWCWTCGEEVREVLGT